jgi:hypothetical protein
MRLNINALRKSWVGRLAGFLLLGVVFYFVVGYVYRNWSLVKDYDWEIKWPLVLLSIGMIWGAYLLAAVRWRAILRHFGIEFRYRQAWRTSALPLLGKYIPGKVWALLGRVYFAVQEGASPEAAGGAAVFAQLSAFPGKALAFLLVAPFMGMAPSNYQIGVALLIMLALMIVLHPRVLFFGLNLALRLIGREQVKIDLDYRTVLGFILASTGISFVNGLAFTVFAASITSLELADVPTLVGAHPLAILLGLVSVFAPAGIGVREGVLLAVLSQRFPPEIAIAVSLGARLWFTVAELSFVAFSWLILRTPKGAKGREEDAAAALAEHTQ